MVIKIQIAQINNMNPIKRLFSFKPNNLKSHKLKKIQYVNNSVPRAPVLYNNDNYVRTSCFNGLHQLNQTEPSTHRNTRDATSSRIETPPSALNNKRENSSDSFYSMITLENTQEQLPLAQQPSSNNTSNTSVTRWNPIAWIKRRRREQAEREALKNEFKDVRNTINEKTKIIYNPSLPRSQRIKALSECLTTLQQPKFDRIAKKLKLKRQALIQLLQQYKNVLLNQITHEITQLSDQVMHEITQSPDQFIHEINQLSDISSLLKNNPSLFIDTDTNKQELLKTLIERQEFLKTFIQRIDILQKFCQDPNITDRFKTHVNDTMQKLTDYSNVLRQEGPAALKNLIDRTTAQDSNWRKWLPNWISRWWPF